MFCEIRMKLLIVVLATIICLSHGKTVKKIPKEDILGKSIGANLKSTAKPGIPAIIKIEIVDPKENKTSKNSKRTIDSSLGYGYQNSFGATNQAPRYEVYKYSQHDIPPYRGPAKNIFSGQNYDVQKSVSYKVNRPAPVYRTAYPKEPVQEDLNQYYQPGTTLYSTINQQGQLGGLTQSPHNYDPNAAVPVILLRVYPSQLAHPQGLYPNLPQSHPFASNLNSVNLQTLLSNYIHSMGHTQHQAQAIEPVQHHHHQQQVYQQHEQPQYQYVQMEHLPTYENYPDEAHTRVIFHHDNGHIPTQPSKLLSKAKDYKTITVQLPADVHQSYSNVQVLTPDTQYSYGSGIEDQNQGGGYYYEAPSQDTQAQNYYYPQADVEYNTEPYQEPQDTTQAPFNYHAHSNGQRTRKNKKRSGKTRQAREKRQEA